MARQTKFIKDSRIANNRVSKYTGVRWDREHSKWVSTVRDKGVTYLCGCFDDDREAAKARDTKIISLGLKKPLQILKRV
jgi:hypothetical protein